VAANKSSTFVGVIDGRQRGDPSHTNGELHRLGVLCGALCSRT
jgi:hypothetical protein